MNQLEQKKRAQEFAEKWQGRGDEKQDAQNFWRDLLVNVLGVPSTSITNFISFERKVQGGFIDGFIEDTGVLIEQKSLGVDLTKAKPQSDGTNLTPYGQAVRYAAKLPLSIRPRWIICSNFEQFLIYDQETDPAGENPYTLMLSDLPNEVYRLAFITDKSNSRLEKEKTLSVKAGAVVGKLYASFAEQYQNIDTDPQEQKSLNVLIVRLVFLLYAEDAGLLQHHGALYDYLKPIPVPQMRQAIIDLFKVLNTPDGTGGTKDERDPYMNPELLAFPYINGGLFSDESLIIPQFTDQIKLDLLVEASSKFDWAEVSPTIFGAVFESTLNPETRHEGGMHYTSVENIHKVIDPLFLDELREKLEKIEALKSDRDRRIRLKAFQNELASIKVFDPACGSGNFLTESYLSLRKLENRVIENLQGDQQAFEIGGDSSVIKVSLSQFYGIEINDFAVSVAKTALWIAESQMIDATQEIVMQVLDFLPLTSNSNIVEGNALTLDWQEVLPPSECSHIAGNPPFLGHQERSKSQVEDMKAAFFDLTNHGKLDYVCAWYAKCAHYMKGYSTRAALVSTNSIVQGESVGLLFPYLFELGVKIDFAYTAFDWASDSLSTATVDCVIIGFSNVDTPVKQKYIFYADDTRTEAQNINGYLCDAPNIYVKSRQPNLNDGAPLITKGSQPTFCTRGVEDPATLFLSREERDEFVAKYPELQDCIRQFTGADEYINNEDRYVFWFDGVEPSRFVDNPEIKPKLEKISHQRAESSTRDVSENWSKKPYLFTQIRQPETNYLIIPRHSSEGRTYIPIGFLPPEIIVGDAAQMISNANLYVFGLVTSRMHMAWMRAICGRLESRYRYSPAVYNSFIWPKSTAEQREKIERAAQGVLDAREAYPESSLAALYDPSRMPQELKKAHEELDEAVEQAYGKVFDGDEEKMVAHLFQLYAEATRGQ